MKLNFVEKAMMNNPLRAMIQRRYEAKRLLAMGGPMAGGRALEVGCGRGVGSEIILDLFGAEEVDAFNLDPGMIEKASSRLESRGKRASLWTGDATDIKADDGTYDAVFDFGIIHHVPNWRDALAEVHRVLKPGGRFYAEEVLKRYIEHPLWRRLLVHPEGDRFDERGFADALGLAGFTVSATSQLWNQFAWFIADKP